MTAKEIIDRFKSSEEEYDFDIFREFDLEDFGLEWVGQHEYLGEVIDEDDKYRREFVTVQFTDHNLIIQEIRTFEYDKLVETNYWTVVPKESTTTLYNADEEII